MKTLIIKLPFSTLGFLAGLVLSSPSFVHSAESPARPPQFVILAFDGSKSNSMWEETRAFAHEEGIRFTYFINSVYFLAKGRTREYRPPAGMPAGRSAIGFGGSTEDVDRRIKNVNAASREDHEIACHAAGHFDGSRWSLLDWTQEFAQFFRSLFTLNTGWEVAAKNFIGFRAPQLGTSPGMWTALREQNFLYDTSDTGTATTWPRKTAQGFWEFPLASIGIAGTAKKTLAMDYNFYYSQSPIVNGSPVDQPQNAAKFSKQMLDSYLNYFRKNYDGNRAPINIGHHFSKWNGGAYWKAMKDFSRAVCRLPEVRCVPYQELMEFMDTLDAETLAAYRKGDFARGTSLPGLGLEIPADSLNAELVVAPDRHTIELQGEDRDALLARGIELKSHFQLAIGGRGPDHLLVQGMIGHDEILRSTYPVREREINGNELEITGPSLESRALRGDLPEAHLGEES